jgi:SAM-dependent methyltransferase
VVAPIDLKNPYTRANAVYFDNHAWASGYFRACHRDDTFKDRWQSAIGSWNDKVIVDIGCGPGNLFATLGGKPKALIGVDVSKVALGMAKEIGYTPLQADAHDLPAFPGACLGGAKASDGVRDTSQTRPWGHAGAFHLEPGAAQFRREALPA